jgi:hypothetical protein
MLGFTFLVAGDRKSNTSLSLFLDSVYEHLLLQLCVWCGCGLLDFWFLVLAFCLDALLLKNSGTIFKG